MAVTEGPKVIGKSWGFEKIIYNGSDPATDYCMKLLVYMKEIASSLHFHKFKHETFYVAHGVFELEIGRGADREIRRLSTGDSVVLPPGTIHRLRCKSIGTIVEASTYDDPEDCVRLERSE
jgi:quercetin dioxygenase-like cupin family protein